MVYSPGMAPRLRAFLLLACVATAMPCRATEILVHAAASLNEALAEIAVLHERATGVVVRVDAGASSTLARQVLEGAPGDVFFSADEAKMDQLARARLIDAATRRSLLSNALVVVVPIGSELAIRCTADLATEPVKLVALADPGSVPAGIYAKEHFERLGIWSAVLPKIVPTENVRGALAAAESGNVDAAVVYATDARLSKQVRVTCRVPADQGADISYSAAVLSGSDHPAEARAFVAFLGTPEARAVFERLGFVVRR